MVMGNSAISRKVQDLPKEPTATAGHLQLWKIWPGVRKDTGEECSVWAFDKADLSKKGRHGGEITDKAVQEQLFQIMVRDMKSMKECECGGLVKVIEIVEETKSTLAFISERVVCSLADCMYSFENIPNGQATHAHFFESDGSISEMEISRALYTLAEGLQVLHTVHRRLHLNLCPESVVLTTGGYMKICGLGLSLAFQAGDSRLASPYFLKAAEASNKVRLEPDLRYCGPETTLGGVNPTSVRYLTPSEDVFALGVLIFELYRFNLKELKESRRGAPHLPLVPLYNNSVAQHHSALEILGGLDMAFLPSGLAPLLVGMLQPQPSSRVGTTDICSSAFFATGSLAVLRAVDTLHTRDTGTQCSQLIALLGQLSSFPVRLLLCTVLPAVCKLCSANPALWVHALPLHVHLVSSVASRVPTHEYRAVAGKYVSEGLRVTQPVEVMQAFLRNMAFLVDAFGVGGQEGAFFTDFVIKGLFVNCLDKSQHVTLQLQALSVLCSDERVRNMIDAPSLLDVVVPKVCREACKNPEANVKVVALYFLSLIVHRLDKAYLAKNMLPSLKYITEHDKAPAVSMAVVGMYETMSETLGADYIATAILPSLTPLIVERSLDKAQFSLLSSLVLRLVKKIFDLRTNELSLPAVGMGGVLGGVGGGATGDAFGEAKEILARTQAQIAAQGNSSLPYQSLTLPVDFSSGGGGGAGMPPPPPSTPAPSQLPPSPKAPPPPLPAGLPAPSGAGVGVGVGGGYGAVAGGSILAPPPIAVPSTLAAAWGGGGGVASSGNGSGASASTYQPPPDDDFLASFNIKPTKPARSNSIPAIAPPPSSSVTPTLSIEEQIKQTQAQIQLLSAGMGAASSVGVGGMPGYGMGMGMMPQQQQQMGMGMGMGMMMPTQQQQQPMGGYGVQQQMGYGAPPMQQQQQVYNQGGYRPPVVPMSNAPTPMMAPHQQQPKADPFDFLN